MSPPSLVPTTDEWFNDLWGHAIAESKLFAKHYAGVAKEMSVISSTRARVAKADPTDGGHLDAANTTAIGTALVPVVKGILDSGEPHPPSTPSCSAKAGIQLWAPQAGPQLSPGRRHREGRGLQTWPTTVSTSSSSAAAPAAMWRRSARRSWASRRPWWSASIWAASASTGAASRPRRCCARPRSTTT